MREGKDEFVSFLVEQNNESVQQLMDILQYLTENVKQLEEKLDSERQLTAMLRQTIDNQSVQQKELFYEITRMYGLDHTTEFASLVEFMDFVKEQHSFVTKQYVSKVSSLKLHISRLEEVLFKNKS